MPSHATAQRHEESRISTPQAKVHPDEWTKVVTASIGFGWNNAGRTQTILLEPDIEKTYTATNMNGSIFQGEVFGGMQHKLSAHLLGQAGIAIAGATRAGFGGDVWEDANSELANYTYSYGVQHTHVAIEGKLLADMGLNFMPYINGSLGAGFNKAQHFTITPKLEEEVPAPSFQSHTTTAFTYTAGVGMQKTLNRHWQVGLGYLFSDWGKSQFSAAPGQTLNTAPSLSHIYVNSVLFNLSYLG